MADQKMADHKDSEFNAHCIHILILRVFVQFLFNMVEFDLNICFYFLKNNYFSSTILKL